MNGMALCAGYGGLELAVRIACPGYRTVCYVEREAFPAAVLAASMGSELLAEAPIWDDLASFDGSAWRGRVDLITAGFPCQPWSHAGKREGLDDERWIWPLIAGTIRDVRPRYVFLENVPGLVSGGGLEPVLGDLAALGFDAEWDVFSAAEVGAPHLRERVFILAYSTGTRSSGGQSVGRRRAAPVADGDREDMADGTGGGRRERGEPSGGGGLADGCVPDVADAAHERKGRLPTRSRGSGVGTVDFDGGSEAVGDSDVGDDDGAGDAGPGGRREPTDASRIFPPGPDGDWRSWLAERPGTEPSIRRSPDGTPLRAHRLSALGNGVVPLQAAMAFVALAERAGLT